MNKQTIRDSTLVKDLIMQSSSRGWRDKSFVSNTCSYYKVHVKNGRKYNNPVKLSIEYTRDE